MFKRAFRAVLLSLLFALLAGLLTGSVMAKERIEFWVRVSGNDALRTMVKEYNNSQSSIEVVLQELPGDDYRTKLLTAVASGSVPDVVGMDVAILPQYLYYGALADVTANIEATSGLKDDFYEGLWFGLTENGKSYGLPWWADPSVMWYNKTIFEESGLTEAPVTWDEFRAAGQKTTKKDPSPTKTRYGLIFDATGPWMMFTWLPFLWSAGGDLLDQDGRAAFDTPAAADAVELWANLFQDGCVPRSSVLGGADLWQLFANQTAAMAVQGPSIQTAVDKYGPGTVLGNGLIPKKLEHSSYLGGDALVIMKDSKNKQAAWEFIVALNSQSNQQRFSANNNGVYVAGIPTRKSVFTDGFRKEYPLMAVFADAMSVGRVPGTRYLSEIRVPLWNAAQQVFLNRADISTQLKDANRKANEIISKWSD